MKTVRFTLVDEQSLPVRLCGGGKDIDVMVGDELVAWLDPSGPALVVNRGALWRLGIKLISR